MTGRAVSKLIGPCSLQNLQSPLLILVTSINQITGFANSDSRIEVFRALLYNGQAAKGKPWNTP